MKKKIEQTKIDYCPFVNMNIVMKKGCHHYLNSKKCTENKCLMKIEMKWFWPFDQNQNTLFLNSDSPLPSFSFSNKSWLEVFLIFCFLCFLWCLCDFWFIRFIRAIKLLIFLLVQSTTKCIRRYIYDRDS